VTPEEADPDDPDPCGWIIDLEISLAQRFDWSLHEIDESDAENLLRFIYRLGWDRAAKPKPHLVYCDQAGWL
jgi:hypothetical protein